MIDPRRWARDIRLTVSRLPIRMGRIPDAPALSIRDPWPGDSARGARLLKGEMELAGAVRLLAPGLWTDATGPDVLRAAAHGFTWLRDLRALGTDAARSRARDLVADWIASAGRGLDRIAERPDVAGARITAWLGHYDFFVASADDPFRASVMARLVADARLLAASVPGDELDARALTALKGLIAAAVALPTQNASLTRAMRLLPQEIARQVLPDGCHAERSPAAQLTALQDLTEIRALLQAALAQPPAALSSAIERMAPALRALRHGDGGLALFNGAREESATLIELVLTQAGRGGRAPAGLTESGFQRLQAGRSVLIVDCGAPPPHGIDRLAHAGTLSMELSIGRERMIVNCGAAPPSDGPWRDAARATAAHSTLVIADTNSSELKPVGLGRVPTVVDAQRQEANGAHWLEARHNGYRTLDGAIHHRRLYVADSGEDIRGEDTVESPTPLPFAVRFHLHPTVVPSMQQDGKSVVLRLPGGGIWTLRAKGADIALEESIYLGAGEPRTTQQIVLTGEGEVQKAEWAITKVG
jgi:uncharacterized heparinase superfamily protein